MIYTHSFQISNFENSLLPDFENRILSEVGDPKDEARFNLDVTKGPFTIGYIGRYLGPQLTSTYENFYTLDVGLHDQYDAAGLPAAEQRCDRNPVVW